MLFIQSGPIPPYNNPPIEPQFYQPSRFVIEDITQGITTLVTTTEDQNYVIGQEIRFLIPSTCGIFQLNEIQGYVISIPSSNQVEIDIDSRFMNSFIPVVINNQNLSYPQIIAIGDISSGAINSSGTINLNTSIPGSFINISPL